MDLKHTIEEKIKKNLICDFIEVNNKSHLHKSHKQSPKNNNSHFEIIISSIVLKKLSVIDAHKKIYDILKEEMKSTIHALEIKIL